MTRLRALSTLSPETPYAFIVGVVLVVAVLAIFLAQIGAIEKLNASGLLG
jgi:hypothetical protein